MCYRKIFFSLWNSYGCLFLISIFLSVGDVQMAEIILIGVIVLIILVIVVFFIYRMLY